MLPAIMHRRWAREYLARAEQAPDRRRKLNYLRLAITNSVRAQNMESELGRDPDAKKNPASCPAGSRQIGKFAIDLGGRFAVRVHRPPLAV
jgi:hypothetical protein